MTSGAFGKDRNFSHFGELSFPRWFFVVDFLNLFCFLMKRAVLGSSLV
jgi:hypothetical protein